ncbi:pantoate--beta-alanine ligase [candidate division KSB1 bacterium]|nr:pantoate--beta-alanine ligase [candidate division KSB1 bacterium]
MLPTLIQSVAEMQAQSSTWRAQGQRIGLVPTMGYLHEGHLSLMRLLRPRCDTLVASIFVNPIQFGPHEDLARYPRDLQRDMELCAQVPCEVVFHPSAEEIYPENFRTHVEVSELTENLCGPFRPGHFRGVTTVVGILFNIVQPHLAAFGQKDAQQALVLERMVRDLRMPIEIVIGPTRREPDGLAMSSRNVYLQPEERKQATALYHALLLAEKMINSGERRAEKVVAAMTELITHEVTTPVIEYISVVDRQRLHPLESLRGQFVIALAVRIGKTRLIDNMFFEV